MLSAAFRLTALLFIPVGLYLYFLPPQVAAILGVSPLWLARILGGLLFGWGVFQIVASLKPDGAKVAGLAGGNLLIVAALLPPALRSSVMLPGMLRGVLLGLCVLMGVLAIMAIVSYPPRGPREQ